MIPIVQRPYSITLKCLFFSLYSLSLRSFQKFLHSIVNINDRNLIFVFLLVTIFCWDLNIASFNCESDFVDVVSINDCLKVGVWIFALLSYYSLWISERGKCQNCEKNHSKGLLLSCYGRSKWVQQILSGWLGPKRSSTFRATFRCWWRCSVCHRREGTEDFEGNIC